MEITIVVMNVLYSVIGACLALFFMILGYKVFDRITPFSTAEELANQNTAVGIVLGSIFIGLGIAIGLVIGMGLN